MEVRVGPTQPSVITRLHPESEVDFAFAASIFASESHPPSVASILQERGRIRRPTISRPGARRARTCADRSTMDRSLGLCTRTRPEARACIRQIGNGQSPGPSFHRSRTQAAPSRQTTEAPARPRAAAPRPGRSRDARARPNAATSAPEREARTGAIFETEAQRHGEKPSSLCLCASVVKSAVFPQLALQHLAGGIARQLV